VRRLLWFLLATVTVVVFLLILKEDGGTIAGLSRLDISSLGIKIVVLVFLAALVFTLFRERFSRALEAALIWVVIVVLLAVGYTYRFQLRGVAENVLAELVPGYVATNGRTVMVARTQGGGFSIDTIVNGARVRMVLDTGASSVVLTQEAAKAAGLPLEVLSYSVTVDTANGRTRAAAVTLDTLAVGGIVERAVPALIAQRGQLRTNLLGMTFLNRLESWEVRGDRLVMRAYP
jgi:aspartyl protease family protein